MKPVVKMNADVVVNNIKRMMDITDNFVPFFIEVVGKQNDSRRWTLRGSVAKSFGSKSSPYDLGGKWKPLSKDYMTEKAKKYPGMPLLVASGSLFNSLVRSNSFSVVVMDKKVLHYGTTSPYAKYHMTGTSKMPARAFIGYNEKQVKSIKALLKSYVRAGFESQKAALEAIKNNVSVDRGE